MQNNECIYIREQFTEYQDGSLSLEIKSKIDAHINSCPPCQSLFQELSTVLKKLHSLPHKSVSEDFTSNLLDKINAINNETITQKFYRSSYARVAGYAIAAGLLVAIGINMWVDPVSPMRPGSIQKFANEQSPRTLPVESLAETTDSANFAGNDSLELKTSTIRSNNQSLQLVSGTKK